MGIESQVILSRAPAGRLIVFVHGYTGKAVGTWEDFDTILPAEADLKDCDFLFYGYPGFSSNVVASAALLYQDLDAIFHEPRTIVQDVGILTRRPIVPFQKVLLVGHSLGSLLIRWALLMAHQDSKTWLNSVKFVLFAPAHSGNLLDTAAEELKSASSWLSFGTGATALMSPFLKELSPGSAVIEKLKEGVLQSGSTALRAVKVVIAELDKVVSNLPFPGDPVPIGVRDKGHISVCKPGTGYDLPVRIVKESL